MDDFTGEGGLLHSLNTCLGLFFLLISLLGAVLCIVYRRLSSWLFLAMAGFLTDVFVGILRQVAGSVLRHLDVSPDIVGIVYLLLSVFNLFAAALILIGFALALGKVQQQLSRIRHEEPAPFPRMPPPQASEPFHERKEGSPDIQR
jgi:hypothetical protein